MNYTTYSLDSLVLPQVDTHQLVTSKSSPYRVNFSNQPPTFLYQPSYFIASYSLLVETPNESNSGSNDLPPVDIGDNNDDDDGFFDGANYYEILDHLGETGRKRSAPPSGSPPGRSDGGDLL